MLRKSAGGDSFLDMLTGGGGGTDRSQEATYYICRKVMAESIGKLPCKVLEHQGDGGIREAHEHKLYDVLRNRPNPYMTATGFWSTMEALAQDYGNSFAYIERASRGQTRLWIMDPREVEVWWDNAMLIYEVPDVFYIWRPQGREVMLTSQEAIHIRTSDSADGLTGKSVLEQLSGTIEGSKKAQTLMNNLYNNGMTAKAVLQYTGDLSKEKRDQFVAGIQSYMNGSLKEKGIENIIPLPVGTTLTPLNMKLSDSQFLELKRYSAIQIASAFGCKAYHIGDATKTSYSSEEAQQLAFYVDTILYRLSIYEQELTYKLLTEKERARGLRIKFNEKVALRADMQTQASILTMYVAAGLMSHNEAREQLDLPASPYGNDLMVSNGAAIPLKYLGAQYGVQSSGQQSPPMSGPAPPSEETSSDSEPTPTSTSLGGEPQDESN